MLRRHSFYSAINEILVFSKEVDLCRIGLVGDPHSGKSTMALAIAHSIHSLSKKKTGIEYSIKLFTKKELLNFKETMKNLSPTNYVLIFDDVSFLDATASVKDIKLVKQAMTEIRHLEDNHDVKIITIMNYHYTLGLDKYLRQADFRFFTTVGSSEFDNIVKIMGNKNLSLVRDFQKKRKNAIHTKKFPFRIGSKDIFAYRWKDPFIVVLFYNEVSGRCIVSPTREWLQKICSKCSEGTNSLSTSEIPVEQLMLESEKKFGKGAWLSAIKLALYTEGMTTYSGRIVQGLKYLNKCRDTKLIKLEECAVHYNLETTKTKLKKKLDGIMNT